VGKHCLIALCLLVGLNGHLRLTESSRQASFGRNPTLRSQRTTASRSAGRNFFDIFRIALKRWLSHQRFQDLRTPAQSAFWLRVQVGSHRQTFTGEVRH